MREGPEEEQRQCERDGEEGCDAVAGAVVWYVAWGGTTRVADETGDVYLYEGEVVQVEAPSPDACEVGELVAREVQKKKG